MRWEKGSSSFPRSEHEERGSLRPFSPLQKGVSDPFSHCKRENPVPPKIPLAKIPLAQRMSRWLARKFHSRSKFSVSLEISNLFDLWAFWVPPNPRSAKRTVLGASGKIPLRPDAPGSKSFSPPPGPQEKRTFLVRTSTIFGADVHDPKGCRKTLYKKSLR